MFPQQQLLRERPRAVVPLRQQRVKERTVAVVAQRRSHRLEDFKHAAAPLLLAGAAALQVLVMPAGPAIAQELGAQPSIDMVANAGDMFDNVEGGLSGIEGLVGSMAKVAPPSSQDLMAALEKELEHIEKEIAELVDEEIKAGGMDAKMFAEGKEIEAELSSLSAMLQGMNNL